MLIFEKKILPWLTILIGYCSVFVIFKDDTYVLIHDYLDSHVAWHKILINSNNVFGSNFSSVDQVADLKRVSLGNEFDIKFILTYFFDSYWGYAFLQILSRLFAFIGMILFLCRFLNEPRLSSSTMIASLLFSLLPFYPGFGLGISGIPFFAWIVLLSRKDDLRWSLLIIAPLIPIFMPLSTNLLFIFPIVLIVFARDVLRRNLTPTFFWFLIYLLLTTVLINYRYVDLLLNDTYVSQRIERVDDQISFGHAVLRSIKHFIFGQYHAQSIHFPILALLAPILVKDYIKGNFNRPLILLLGLNFLLSLGFGFWYYSGFSVIKQSAGWLNLLNFSRFSYLAPFVWYVILALALREKIFHAQKQRIFISIYLFFYLSLLFFKSDYIQERRNHDITYREFYSVPLFDDIRNRIDENYYVVGLGLHPAILQYNGLKTLDGYMQVYSLDYKKRFREIIATELQNDKALREYFDEWGNRFYVFSSKLGKNWLIKKRQSQPIDVSLNINALTDLGARYIISSVEVNNFDLDEVKLVDKFERDDSPWQIYLYEIIL